jgi:hypothetical protein
MHYSVGKKYTLLVDFDKILESGTIQNKSNRLFEDWILAPCLINNKLIAATHSHKTLRIYDLKKIKYQSNWCLWKRILNTNFAEKSGENPSQWAFYSELSFANEEESNEILQDQCLFGISLNET